MANTKKRGWFREWVIEPPLRAARAALLSTAVALQEALTGSATGSLSSSDGGDVGWRPITERVAGKGYRRDLTPMSQAEMLRVAHYLYTGNALAQFLINVPVAMTIGRSVGYTIEFDHEKLGISREEALDLVAQARKFLDPWWEHPAHDFKHNATRYARTYLVTGEILLVIPEEGVNETTGLFMLDYIDSGLIADVLGKGGLATTPGEVLVQTLGGTPKAFKVMLPDAAGRYEGECFFFRHTGVLNSLRGKSDLLAQADWIDLHDNLLFGRVDKAILSNTLVHDITVQNASTAAELKEHVDTFKKAADKPGGVYAHNERVTHAIKVADLKEADAAVLVRTVLLHVLGSKGFPEHWFSDGGNSNKASSGEQTDTAHKILEELQEELTKIFALPLTVAYDRLAEKQSIFPKRSDGAVRLHPDLPKISEKDISRMGQVIAQVEAGLDAAVSSGRLSKKTAQRVTLTLIEKITGEHIDAADESARIEAEVAAGEEHEQERRNQAAKAAAELALQLGEDPEDEDPADPAAPGKRKPSAARAAEEAA
jgi:hypothetical protein